MKVLKGVFITIGILVVIGGGIFFIFYKTASNEGKKKFLQEVGLDETGFARDVASEVFVECEILNSRRNIMNTKWVINGKLYTTNPAMAYSYQKVKFQFSDGDEFYQFNYNLNGNQTMARPFQVRIPGHKDATLLGVEVVEAK